MKLTAFIEGLGVGMLAAYFLDPDRGGRRRAMVRDQVVHQSIKKREAVRVMARDLVNRSQGMRHRIASRFDHSTVSDEIVLERVKAELGRHISHFHSIELSCENGVVTLSGPILASEIQDCLWHARMVRGVKHVVNGLQPHASSENIPELQGGIQAAVSHRWSPGTSLFMGAFGVFLTAYGIGRRGMSGKALQLVGASMVAKAFHDTEHRFDPSRPANGRKPSGGQSGTKASNEEMQKTPAPQT